MPRYVTMHNPEENTTIALETPITEKYRKALGPSLPLIDMLLGNLQIMLHWALRIMPIEVCSSIGCLLGRIIGPRHRNATQQLRENISRLRPDISSPQQMDLMVKHTWGNYGRVMTEFSVLRRIWRSDRTEIEGFDHLTHAKSLGQPIIYTFLHLGNWEVLGPALYRLHDEHLIQIYQEIDDRYQLKIAENVRRPYKHALLTNTPFVGKKIYNKLKDGYALSIAVDAFVNNELNTPSFGRPLSLTGNLAYAVRLAKLTNAIICPAYVTRKKGARFTLHILPPVIFDFTDFNKTKLHLAIAQLDKLLDPIIRKHIDQWYYGSALHFSKSDASPEKNKEIH